MLRKFLKSRASSASVSGSIPAGERVYAVGDIHGRIDLLDDLLVRIDADDRTRSPARTTLIFLGDFVDRGPRSAAVLDRLIALRARHLGTRFLMGNHEEIFLGVVEGDEKAMRMFCRVGGRETALSYGIAPEAYDRSDYGELARLLQSAVPRAHRDFLATLEDVIEIGDYAFVHAGIRPGRPLADQRTADLRWIREPFLDHAGPFEKIVVHGHTVVDEIETGRHRIGIDTGAYATGRLSAVGLEGAALWLLQTAGPGSGMRSPIVRD